MLKIYLIIINAMAFLLMLADKLSATGKGTRIPERVLLGCALVGGSLGALAGMYLCHHKTRKPKFYISIPIMFLVQVVLIFVIGKIG